MITPGNDLLLVYICPKIFQTYSNVKLESWKNLDEVNLQRKNRHTLEIGRRDFFNWLHDCQKNILWLYQEFLEDEAIGQWRNLSDLNL